MAKRTLNIDKIEHSDRDDYPDELLLEMAQTILLELRRRADRDRDNASGPGADRFDANAKARHDAYGVAFTALRDAPKKL